MGNYALSKYYQSFSGTDTVAFLMMPGCSPITIGSLTTISYSMYRNKKPVINIGRTNINGVTRGSRIFAGTMIFTLINQHWVRELQEEWTDKAGLSYLNDISELKVDELPLFDIMIVSANEYGSAVAMYIYGIDFTDEAQTISVEDLFTENTFSFIARDVSVFKNILRGKNITSSPNAGLGDYNTVKVGANAKYFVIDSSIIDLDDLDGLEHQFDQAQWQIDMEHDKLADYEYLRELSYNPSKNYMMGGDVLLIQGALKDANLYNGDMDGIYDEEVESAIKLFQADNNLKPTGIVDRKTYIALLEGQSFRDEDGHKIGIVINKHGTYAYSDPTISSTVTYTFGYNDTVPIDYVTQINVNGVVKSFAHTSLGYVLLDDIFSIYSPNAGPYEFPLLASNVINDPAYVMIVQNALQKIYPDFINFQYGIYDAETVKYIKRFQSAYGDKYGIPVSSGTCGYNTWLGLQEVSGSDFNEIKKQGYTAVHNKATGDYEIKASEALDAIKEFSSFFTATNKVMVKATVVAHYPNGNSITTPKVIEDVNGKKISLYEFRDQFLWNTENHFYPNKVEFFITPANNMPFKWVINIKNDMT